MSEEISVSDIASGGDGKVNGDEATGASSEDAEKPREVAATHPAAPEPEEPAPKAEVAPEAPEPIEVKPESAPQPMEVALKVESVDESETPALMDVADGQTEPERGIKRRASEAFSENTEEFRGFSEGDAVIKTEKEKEEEFKGFDTSIVDEKDISMDYSKVLDRLEAEVSETATSFKPVRTISAIAAVRASKRMRQDTDGSRPSSALSSRSDGEGMFSNEGSPLQRGGRRATTEMSSPLLRIPLERGWRRELVYRAALDQHQRRNADIYYYTPKGKKLRSTREVSEHLSGTGLTLENFSFFKEPLGIDDPEKEIIRDAKLMRRVESPVAAAPLPAEGKRTPKPKPPKGASPEPAGKSPPIKLKVKSMGSRLIGSAAPTSSRPVKKPAPPADNNNSAAWKKPSDEKRTRGRLSNGVSEEASPRRRARAKPEQDHFTAFYTRAKEHGYNVVTQIFQYVGMRDLARCARVCRLWRQLAATPKLWRHVRMKNSHVSDWAGLCSALKRHGTTRLDLRKMLLPQNDVPFWQQFAEHIPTVDTLERIEMCRCPAGAVEAVCRGAPNLRSLSALAIRDALLDPGPLASLPKLQELRLKSMAGLSLTQDLRPLAALTQLQHLSLTSIKELGWCASDVIGQLDQLESLELGECTFRAEFANVLRKLKRLRRLRLERGTAQCAAPQLLRALATLPLLTRLELVNIDVKVGFDDALAECKNIQRLLIIPTYVSQSATTNKQVLSGVLRLKDTLTHLMWGVTIELLRVTELFIDQCSAAAVGAVGEGVGVGGPVGAEKAPRELGECIPVLKPVPGCRLPDHAHVHGPPQVEILPLPTLQRLLSAQLPHTKLKLLRIPFHATWRQSLADFQ